MAGLLCRRVLISVPRRRLGERVQPVELEFGSNLKQEGICILVVLIHPVDDGVDCPSATDTVLVVDAQERLCGPELESFGDLHVSHADNQTVFGVDAVPAEKENLLRVEGHYKWIVAPIEPRNTKSGPGLAHRV